MSNSISFDFKNCSHKSTPSVKIQTISITLGIVLAFLKSDFASLDTTVLTPVIVIDQLLPVLELHINVTKWYVCLWLLLNNTSEIQSDWFVYQQFLLYYLWSYCGLNGPRFVFPSPGCWICGLFPVWSYYK